MTAYYNEIDPYAAQWLRNLIAAGHIAPGDVDERSIADVRPDDLRGYTQAHFFAGIGGWSLALRLAGWPDDRSVWTGSCPCQPFSAAGKGKAADDERHLWPRWLPLIAECRPAIVFGEQVEAAIGWGWLDAVFADLEAEGYACGAAVLPACGVGAPHIRQRLWFVADADAPGRRELGSGRLLDRERTTQRDNPDGRGAIRDVADAAISRRHEQPQWPAGTNGRKTPESRRLRDAGELANTAEPRCDASERSRQRDGGAAPQAAQSAEHGRMGDAGGARPQERERDGRVQRGTLESSERQAPIGRSDAGSLGHADREREAALGGFSGRPLAQCSGSPWAAAEWIACRDGKSRPVEPGTFPLAHGIPGRVGRLRAYGNAIVPQVAAEFIRAATD